MSTNLEGPARLPAAAVPDDCRAWDGEGVRRWTGALSPRWAPVRGRARYHLTLGALVAASPFLVPALADVRPYVAALLACHVVWVSVRPEVVPVTAPALAVVLLTQHPRLPWAVTAPVVAALAVSWTAAGLRLRARGRQREAALAAADGVTAPPPGKDRPLERGTFLVPAGLVLAVLGGVLPATADAWNLTGDPEVSRTVGCCALGLGLTAALSGVLGRRRATALRRAPVPVLRVLARDDGTGDTEVFAADDRQARRPLFVVSLRDLPDDDDDEDDDEDEDEVEDDDDEDDELEKLLAGLDTPGPLSEAVLYGVPCDGAEILLVRAEEEADEPPARAWSTGPVRPLSEGAARRRVAALRKAAAREQTQEERRTAVVRALDAGPVPVRRWGAGWWDRLGAAALVLFGCFLLPAEDGVWRYVLAAAVGLMGVLSLPRKAAWRITADSSGLWLNDLRGTRHVAWDHIRVVECRNTVLRVDSHRASFPVWSVHGPRLLWLERRFGLVHPYERTAAEITAMWRDPALRPTGSSSGRERGRPLWPVSVVLAVAWAVVLVFLLP
ncbi:hypothetical protein [Streptomyces sp. NPDC005301]|uniref:hypothetical protein n=1 Tax=unclassified Streptomyces TaxID=2593676 RepID=UPI0033A868E4